MTVFSSELERIAIRRITKVTAGVLTLGVVAVGGLTFLNHANVDPDMAVANRLSAESTASCMDWAAQPESGVRHQDLADVCFSDPQWFVEDNRFHFSEAVGQAQEGQTWEEVRQEARARNDIYSALSTDDDEPSILPVKQAAYGFNGGLISFAMAISLAAALLGASYLGADWRSGVIESQLVRVPNRARLIGGKFAATAVACAIGSAVFMGAFLAALVPSAIWRGDFGLAGQAFWTDVAGVVGRTMIVAAVMATIGASLALLARNTAAGVAGILLAFIGGVFLVNTAGRWTSFVTLSDNLQGFIARADVPFILRQEFPDGGQSWDRVVSHGYLAAGLLLVVAALGAMLMSGSTFIRRDVN